MSAITKNSIVDEYFAWLKGSTFVHKVNDSTTRVSLPFLDRNNDYTEIYIVKKTENEFFLTDDGAIYNELEFSGFNFTKDRLKILDSILLTHGIARDVDNALFVSADADTLYFKKHMLAQCMVKVSDMFILSNPRAKSLFAEDIAEFFDTNEVRYVPNHSIIGKSKLPSIFDFVIPGSKSKNVPARLIKGYSKLDNDKARLLLFSWKDTEGVRAENTELLVYINDIGQNIRQSAISSLQEYSITSIAWQDRQNSLPRLLA